MGSVRRLGRGESDKPHDSLQYLEPLIVSDIVAVLDVEQVQQALVWGHSLGARKAASLAELEPGRVTALVCGAGAPMPRSQEQRTQVAAMAERLKSAGGNSGRDNRSRSKRAIRRRRDVTRELSGTCRRDLGCGQGAKKMGNAFSKATEDFFAN